MKPNPEIIKDFSALQAECAELSASNIRFAQENARLREDKRRLDGLESIPYQLEIVCKQSRPKTEGLPTLREQIDYFLANAGNREATPPKP